MKRDFTVNGTLDNQAQGCFFDGDQKFHLAGSQWHPYIPPFGFDRCSVCTCLPETLTITCKQSITCPALTCSPEEAYRENASDCCKKCPNIIQVKSIDAGDELSDQSLGPRVKSANELVLAGGCIFNERVYPNGDEWHPYVAPFGEMRCVKCHCKNKTIKCGRIKCPSVTCSKPIIPEDRCCPVCSDD
uniref:VWFC domain-containing protein n=1 Tax=Tetranychus urticae TaxID=32264 RepID=T1K4R0_TETUR